MSRQLIDTVLGRPVTLASERKPVPISKEDLARFVGVYDISRMRRNPQTSTNRTRNSRAFWPAITARVLSEILLVIVCRLEGIGTVTTSYDYPRLLALAIRQYPASVRPRNIEVDDVGNE
jgi:hypothetical protein